jgi:hypothetical protein
MTTCSTARRVGATKRVLSAFLITTLTTSLVAPAAFAQEQPQAENVAAARSLGLQGIKLADAGDCKGAIEKLSRAESLYHAPSILGRLGECQVNVGQVVAGTENLNRVVREQLAATAPKAFKDAQERAKGVLNTALPKIARLTVRVEPADAKPQVTVAGTTIPAALIGVERPTDPGTHEVLVTAPGYLDQKTSVTLAEGGTQDLSIKLEKDPNAAAATPPPAVVAPPPVVTTGPTQPPADTAPKKNNTLAYVALGVGGVGLVVGGVTGFLALGKKSDLKDCVGNSCPSSQKDTLDSAKSMATISTVGFTVGFVGVGVGVVLLLTGGGSNNASAAKPQLAKHAGDRLQMQPYFGGNAAGVTGTF